MKADKIINVIKKRKYVKLISTYVVNEETGESHRSEQWVSNGYAAYPLEKLPYLDSCAFATLAGTTEEKLCCFEQDGTSIILSDSHKSDKQMENAELTINGYSLYYAGEKPIFIDYGYLSPIDEEYELYLRENSYVVVKVGMFIQAVIIPSGKLFTEEIANKLEELSESIEGFKDDFKKAYDLDSLDIRSN